MKRFLFIMLMVLATLGAFAQATILYRDSFTILYSPPAVLPVLLPGESTHYDIWLWDMSQGSPPLTSTVGWIYVDSAPTLSQYVITPTDPRREYAVGVQFIHVRTDGIETASDFAVTTNPADIDAAGVPGVPFVYAPATTGKPGKVRNLRDAGT